MQRSTLAPSSSPGGKWPLEGKRILITGAAKRIGRSIALHLHEKGARVLVHYGHSRQAAEEVAAACAWQGRPAPLYQADLSKVDEIVRMFSEIGESGDGLDGLVNNAGRFKRVPVLEMTEADWDFIHSVNLKAVFFCCQQAAKLMLERETGGRIVNLSSLGGIRAWGDYAHYCASKAGVIHMTRSLAKAFSPTITVNSVAPGIVPFEAHDQPHVLAGIQLTPAGRAGSGEDIAEAVAFLLSQSGFVTGQTVAVDGGLNLV
ncbi:MAG: SDR family oxidoreductase [Bryobacterales bacterium]|nr:SDR family oxidoreductase [Bryobacterales bacterium]